jgi:hypothetical protein
LSAALRGFAGAPVTLNLPFQTQTFLRPRFGVAGVLLVVLPRLLFTQFDFFGRAGGFAFGSGLGKLEVEAAITTPTKARPSNLMVGTWLTSDSFS